jgi:negative regulator of sigma E activity
VYRRSDVVQRLYSDGLYDLSVFEQRGRLRRDDLPDGAEQVDVAGSRGWRYAWPGGSLVIWEARGTVFTAVGDAPLDDILLAARSVPPPPARDASFWDKLRAACATLVQPLRR